MKVAPLHPLPKLKIDSPAIVTACDRIRVEMEKRGGFEEFCWFIREYPRCYRFHMRGADFRLKTVHDLMRELRSEILRSTTIHRKGMFEYAISNMQVSQLYWDFESFLSEISIALDLVSRVVGPAFRQQSSPSFNRLCKSDETHPLIDLFRAAQKRWVIRLKNYRDCFTHYTPVDTLLTVALRRYDDQWEVRAKLPTNPNVRDISGFRFSRRVELLKYACTVHNHMMFFDRRVAKMLLMLHSKGEYPIRKDHLFFVGRREQS